MVYFEGMVDTWKYLSKNDFSLEQLYFGKMSYQDVEKAIEMNPEFEPLLPSFYVTDKAKYQQIMKEIGQINYLDQF